MASHSEDPNEFVSRVTGESTSQEPVDQRRDQNPPGLSPASDQSDVEDVVARYLRLARDPSVPANREDGWRRIFDHYGSRLFYKALGSCDGNEIEAQIIVDDTLSHAWEAFDTCEATTGPAFSSWLQTSLDNRLKHRAKKQRKEQQNSSNKGIEDILSLLGDKGIRRNDRLAPRDVIEEWVNDASSKLVFADALKWLSPNERLCIWRCSQGYAASEIAVEFSMSIGAVRVHLCNARRKLKQAFLRQSDAEELDTPLE